MGFFDNLKSSLTETGQNLSQKAKYTTEIFRLTNLNKTKEKEIEKVIYQIGSTYYANYRDECVEKMPELAAQSYRLCDKGGRVAVYRCGTDGQPEVLVTITGIYTNLLPENDALRIKRGVTVYSERELDLLLEDLGE